MAILEKTKISQLDQESARVAAGGAQGEVKDASGKVINAGDQANIDYATKNLGYKFGGQVSPDANALASAVEGAGKTPFEAGTGVQGYDAALANEKVSLTNSAGQTVSVSRADYNNNPAYKSGEWKETPATATGSGDWMQDWIKSAFGGTTVGEVEAPTFEAEKARLEQAKTSRIQALDAQYATNLATLQKKNKDLGSSLKARLIKLGVSPSDSAWSNAEAGQAQRDAEAEAGLRAEYMSNKAAIESDLDAKIANIAMNEATMNFNATVKNIENKLATQAQGINLYQIFASRDQSEKDREQRAYSALMDYDAKMLTLDQNQQEAIARNLIDNAQKGLYNISDKATLEMLASLEKQSPYLAGLTNIATAGLSDRLDQKAENAAQLSLIKAQTAAANRSNQKSGGGDDDGKEAENFYKDVDAMADDLAAGKRDWGQAYNFLTGKYGTDIGNEIDALLNKDYWSKPGAYEERQKARQNTNQPTFIINTGA